MMLGCLRAETQTQQSRFPVYFFPQATASHSCQDLRAIQPSTLSPRGFPHPCFLSLDAEEMLQTPLNWTLSPHLQFQRGLGTEMALTTPLQ